MAEGETVIVTTLQATVRGLRGENGAMLSDLSRDSLAWAGRPLHGKATKWANNEGNRGLVGSAILRAWHLDHALQFTPLRQSDLYQLPMKDSASRPVLFKLGKF